jgi:thioredoxin 1
MATTATDKTFKKEVLEHDGLVLVDFWAVWCPPCRALAPILEQVEKEVGDKVKIVKLNVDENRQTAIKYQIQSIPTNKLFKGGKEVNTLIGLMPKDFYLQTIEKFS